MGSVGPVALMQVAARDSLNIDNLATGSVAQAGSAQV